MFLEGADAELLQVGELVTLINWGNVVIKKINRFAGMTFLDSSPSFMTLSLQR